MWTLWWTLFLCPTHFYMLSVCVGSRILSVYPTFNRFAIVCLCSLFSVVYRFCGWTRGVHPVPPIAVYWSYLSVLFRKLVSVTEECNGMFIFNLPCSLAWADLTALCPKTNFCILSLSNISCTQHHGSIWKQKLSIGHQEHGLRHPVHRPISLER